MYFKKHGFPDEDEIVMCKVSNVQYNSVFVNLIDYNNKSGLIHISEVSPGRIRNIRDYVKEGKVIVCKILRVNKERGHIDVSLRRVNESQRRATLENRKNELKAEKIIDALAISLKLKPLDVYNKVAEKILPKYGFLNYSFTDIVENNANLLDTGLSPDIAEPLTKLVLERIKPKEVVIEGDISLSCYDLEGVSIIKEALQKGESTSDQLNYRYLGAGSWRITVTAPDYKDAEVILKESVDCVNDSLKGFNVVSSFNRRD